MFSEEAILFLFCTEFKDEIRTPSSGTHQRSWGSSWSNTWLGEHIGQPCDSGEELVGARTSRDRDRFVVDAVETEMLQGRFALESTVEREQIGVLRSLDK